MGSVEFGFKLGTAEGDEAQSCCKHSLWTWKWGCGTAARCSEGTALPLLSGCNHQYTSKVSKEKAPGVNRRQIDQLFNRSGGDIECPTLAGSNSFFLGGDGGVAGRATDVKGLRAGHGRKTGKQVHEISASKSSRDHVDTAAGHSSVVCNTKCGNNFIDGSGDLPPNHVAISFERHGER
ncbi:MAG: hypothetical protein JRE18_02250 [Deltaproteobacteria bacterium]|nr:hypothetical protein [Deltaproteobacteria bacterium]